jgi:DNA-binding NtrC family response regulator
MRESKGTILVVDDEIVWLELIDGILTQKGYLCLTYSNPDKVMDEIENGLIYNLAFIDIEYRYRKTTGEDIVRKSRKYNPEANMYTITGQDMDAEGLDALDPNYLNALKLAGTKGVIVKKKDFSRNIEAVVERELGR